MNKEKIRLLLEKINGMYRNIESARDPMEPIERDLMLSYIRQLYDAFHQLERQGVSDRHTPPPTERPAPADRPAPEARHSPPPPRPPQPDEHAREPSAPLARLFDPPKTNELGDKLSNSPISDLRRAMTINDRLLYTNELFGGDNTTFERVISILNQYEQFPEAKRYLEQMADQYGWLKDEREEIARDFVRTVHRKFQI